MPINLNELNNIVKKKNGQKIFNKRMYVTDKIIEKTVTFRTTFSSNNLK